MDSEWNIRDLKTDYNEELFQKAYSYIEEFFGIIPEELDDIEIWRNKLNDTSKPVGLGDYSQCTSHMILCMKKEKILGCALSDYMHESKTAFLSYMLVREKYRRCGVGSVLLKECIKATCKTEDNLPTPLFIEINKVGADSRDPMDQLARQIFWTKLGVKALDINYVQPPLEKNGECYTGCVLAVISGIPVTTEKLISFLKDMWKSTYYFSGEDQNLAEKHPLFIKMIDEINISTNVAFKTELPWV